MGILENGKKIYFASDFHLGVPNASESLLREKRIVEWLTQIEKDAAEIYLVGDIFDFWFEYKHVVPKGFVRLLGKLAQIADNGIPIYAFTGNHDMWMFGYFEQELNIPVYKEPVEREWNGNRFLIGHGDGLGPGDHGYKFLKKLFANKLCQTAFAALPPAWGIGLAHYFSGASRKANSENDKIFNGPEKEWLVAYCLQILQQKEFDYFIFGHRHLPLQIELSAKASYVNIGDWIRYNSFAVFDGENLSLMQHHSDYQSKPSLDLFPKMKLY